MCYVTTDLRDLKVKDVELDSVKRQMAWMKEVLAKAAKVGFVPFVEGVDFAGIALLGFIPVVYVDYWDKSQHKVSPVPIRAVSPFMVRYYPPMTLY